MIQTIPRLAREVHVSTHSSTIVKFMEIDRSHMLCFRCGQPGHVRYQCLSHKVRLCWHFSNGYCAEGANCAFAHGLEELRQPWKQRCVRVVRQNGKYVCIGCNSTEHTFRKCPLNKHLIF